MTGQLVARWSQALIGAAGGGLLWLLAEAESDSLLGERLGLALVVLIASFVGSALAMAGPLGLVRAATRAAGLAIAVALLVWLTGLRYSDPGDFFDAPMHTMAALVVAVLPVPFLVTHAQPGWRDYPALFIEAWSILVRFAAALAFTGLVWLVILLSDAVLRLVGVTAIGDLTDHSLVILAVTGAALGLGMAVVYELSGTIAPHLLLRLFRLLLPVVLGVTAVFLVALALQGMDGLMIGLSPALLLLTMVAAGVSLVSVAVDRSDEEAAASALIQRAAQGMSLLLPLLAGLSLWALWQRIDQHGLTPERLFLGLIALVGLAYGLLYAGAVLRGTGWMGRIRRGNLAMALAVIGLAALWLTPILNAERLSTANQMARFEAGQTSVEALDIGALQGWGRPGEAAFARLEARATEPGQEALAARLEGGTDDMAAAVRTADAAELAAILPLQPASATGTRDTLLAAAESWFLDDWLAVCAQTLETGAPACAMAVADLLPGVPGEEAMLFLERSPGLAEVRGLFINSGGFLSVVDAVRADGSYVSGETASVLLRAVQAAPLPLTPALVNQLGTGDGGLLIRP